MLVTFTSANHGRKISFESDDVYLVEADHIMEEGKKHTCTLVYTESKKGQIANYPVKEKINTVNKIINMTKMISNNGFGFLSTLEH